MKIHWDFVLACFVCSLVLTGFILGVMALIGFEMGAATILFATLISVVSVGYQIIEARYDYENDEFNWED